MSDLTYQQKFVIERLAAGNEKVLAMNDAIRGRANFVTGASTAIVGLITAAKFLPANNDSSGVEFIFLAIVCLCSVAIYWLAALVWKGGKMTVPGGTNIDALYDSYISKEPDVAYGNFLSDLSKSMEENVRENALQAARLDRMIIAFISQLFFLALSIAWASVAVLIYT